ncbi:MAG: radical SAM family heme chaperone HemW, partial [Candidatus Eremiobacteraeota bacterium]|nr:radical SAM family heme chaperone HemW [Candidatus Eremiobacteraeota bacterium]
YCDFAKWPMRSSAAEQYLAALYAEIGRTPRVLATTLFLGGGTPNAYAAATIAGLVAVLRERFGAFEETSIEVNPELVRAGDFEVYRAAGISRVSIGVQSFDADEIRTLGRKHTVAQVERVVAWGKAAGIASISLDLMFAVPGQTRASWQRSLERALALGVDHISTYGLTIEATTPYAVWQQREPSAFFDDGAEAELYALAIETLAAAEYEHYEISNFARPGHRCRHNANYWANGEYVGLGVGAASYRDGERSVHTRSLQTYIDAALAAQPIPSEAERLEGARRAAEAIMLALRTAQGVDLAEFKERYGIDVVDHYAPVVSRFSHVGLLERTEDRLRLTPRGRFVANDVCGAFVTFDEPKPTRRQHGA